MATYHYVFSGVVHPERAHLELGAPISFEYQNATFGISGKARLAIYANQVIVDFATANALADMLTLRNLLTDFVSSVADVVGLSAVVAYEVELRSVCSIEEQTSEVFGADVPGLSIGSNELRRYEIDGLLDLCNRVPLFRRALGDFKSAIRHPIDTGFFCYRAVESILHHLRDAGTITSKPAAIEMLNRVLSLDPRCVELLRDLSGDVRHGKIISITGSERQQPIGMTREILQRFAAYVNAAPGAAPSFTPLGP